jgi:hypothetical protein
MRATNKRGGEPIAAPRTVFFGNHRTSLRLEAVMWDALADIAQEHGKIGAWLSPLAQPAVKGFSAKPFAAVEPPVVRIMSMRARSAAGTCRWPG